MRLLLIKYLHKYAKYKAIRHIRNWLFDSYHYRTLNFYFFYIKYGKNRALDVYHCYKIKDFYMKEIHYQGPNPFYFEIGLK